MTPSTLRASFLLGPVAKIRATERRRLQITHLTPPHSRQVRTVSVGEGVVSRALKPLVCVDGLQPRPDYEAVRDAHFQPSRDYVIVSGAILTSVHI